MRFLVACAACLLAGACASLPHPNPADVSRAQARFPTASMESLESGRSAYAARCASCHALHSPQSRSAEQWLKAIDEMEKEVRLAPNERALIAQFLVTMSDRSIDKRMP